MRMPRSSSFSVRDILDLPQMKSSVSSATPVSGGDDNQTENGAANDGSTDIAPQNSFSAANEALTPPAYNSAVDSNNSRLQQSKFFH